MLRIAYLGTKKYLRNCIIILALVLAVIWLLGYTAAVRPTATGVLPLAGKVVAVDPGHGGYDAGMEADGILEKDVVLGIAFFFRELLREAGAEVFLTREKDEDLLTLPTGPKKRRDLENRLKLITEADVDVLISIHANAISSPRWYGAQTFYMEDQEQSKELAGFIQQELIRVLKNTDRKITSGSDNYFLLDNSPVPAVIVEVGFLSNPRERALLVEPAYQRKVAWAIYLGVIKFLTTHG